MSSKYKQVRVLIFYDLPMIEEENVKEYNTFRKGLIKLGCYMIQFSIYAKVLKNETNYDIFVNRVKKIIPSAGEVRIMKVTEKQYEDMIFLSGTQNRFETTIANNTVLVF